MSRKGDSTTTYKNYSLFNVNTKANIALAQIADLKGKINVEYKYSDSSVTGNLSNSWGVLELTDVPRGDSEQERDGDQIKMVSLEGRMLFQPVVAGDDTIIRATIVADTKNLGTDPTGLEVFETASISSLKNMDNKNRFILLYDKVIICGGNTDTSRFTKYYKKMTRKLHYTGPDADQGIGYRLYYMYLTNEPTDVPTQACQFRIRYIDN